MTTAAALTPHRWEAVEYTLARVAQRCAIEGNFTRMREYMQKLHDDSPLAYDDFLYALAVMHPIAREVGGIKPMPPYPPGVRHESVRVPCPRCGHTDPHGSGGLQPPGLCPSCPDGACQPVVIPAGVEGWSVGGRQ